MIIGTAGWSIASRNADSFPDRGSSLERYAAYFRGVEINSSFHRRHRSSTWSKWAQSVPDGFRFSVKIPKTITHQAKLSGCNDLLAEFIDEVQPLREKLAVLLVQLPPKLGFDPDLAQGFFEQVQALTPVSLACEPRNAEWFTPDADRLLTAHGIARVAADPALSAAAAAPGGWNGLAYWRLHGSPRMYRSSYEEAALEAYAAQMKAAANAGAEVWCMFDNTAASEATGNALSLAAKLEGWD